MVHLAGGKERHGLEKTIDGCHMSPADEET
jgi:hypothetical protein